MKPLTVTYAKLNNLGNYENERVEIAVELQDGDTPQAVLDAARQFVTRQFPDPDRQHALERAQRIVDNPDDYRPRELREAQALLDADATEDPPPDPF